MQLARPTVIDTFAIENDSVIQFSMALVAMSKGEPAYLKLMEGNSLILEVMETIRKENNRLECREIRSNRQCLLPATFLSALAPMCPADRI
ncbi:uncharacterized protein J3R85_005915 [Psidium guajava]|nr:uncharacterized protein J3R85_005915 [Psidium guajava]